MLNHLGRRRKIQLVWLLSLVILATFAEMVSLGAILPFLGVLTAPEQVFNHPAAQTIILFLELESPTQLLLPLTVIFASTSIIAGLIRMLLLYTTNLFSFLVGAEINVDIYSRTLYQPYRIHINQNSSEVVNGILVKTRVAIFGVLQPVLTLVSSIILLSGILILMFIVHPQIAAVSIIGIGSIYLSILLLMKNSLKHNSETISRESVLALKQMQEGIHSIRDVLIDGSQEYYIQSFNRADIKQRMAEANTAFITGSPRFMMEAIALVLISSIAYFMNQQSGGVISVIPILGTLVLGAQRLMPILQQIYYSTTSVKGSEALLRDILVLLDKPLPDYIVDKDKLIQKQFFPKSVIKFQYKISLKNVGFRYAPHTPWIFRNINLSFRKGSCIGFIGPTGSGKSTMLDIVMGLLEPTEGTLVIDDQPISDKNQRAWQSHIAHVPQNVYLVDSSIKENIALGIPNDQINQKTLNKVVKQSNIANLIENLPNKYETTVGENGIRLSGGQRQRIGIARALYKKADVLIFDEATSALDNETEQNIMKEINILGDEFTIFLIAHRYTTLRNCDQIIKLGKDGLVSIGSYQDMAKIDS